MHDMETCVKHKVPIIITSLRPPSEIVEAAHSYDLPKGRALLNAYNKVRALSAAERSALPVLARGAAIRFLLTRLVDWLAVPDGALVRPKDPLEYYRKLRFHQSVKSVEDYGL